MTDFTIRPHVAGYAATRHTEDGPYEVWVETWHVEAGTPEGRRYLLDGGRDYGTKGAAKVIAKRTAHNPETAPDRWVEIDPIYGSEAWGPEHEYALACFEADAYGEPRPRW